MTWPDEIETALAAAALGPVTVDLTTIGRRSGKQRSIEIWIVAVNGSVIITGTPGPRDWLANLQADPRCTLHFKNDPSAPGVAADVACVARPITDIESRTRVFEHRSTRWYRDQAPLPDLIANGPMVELERGLADDAERADPTDVSWQVWIASKPPA